MEKNENLVALTVVVGGKRTSVKANLHAPLKTIVPEALKETGNTGQPPDNWEIKDEPGNSLDPNKKIADFGFTATTLIFLSLKAGVGGDLAVC